MKNWIKIKDRWINLDRASCIYTVPGAMKIRMSGEVNHIFEGDEDQVLELFNKVSIYLDTA